MLRSDGHVCDIADLGAQGLEVGLAFDYDAIILDLMLPDISGYDVLSKLRAAQVHTPILKEMCQVRKIGGVAGRWRK